MKKLSLTLGIALSTTAILLSVIPPVNYSIAHPSLIELAALESWSPTALVCLPLLRRLHGPESHAETFEMSHARAELTHLFTYYAVLLCPSWASPGRSAILRGPSPRALKLFYFAISSAATSFAGTPLSASISLPPCSRAFRALGLLIIGAARAWSSSTSPGAPSS